MNMYTQTVCMCVYIYIYISIQTVKKGIYIPKVTSKHSQQQQQQRFILSSNKAGYRFHEVNNDWYNY